MSGLALDAVEALAGHKRHVFGGSTAILSIEWEPHYAGSFAGTLTVTFARNRADYVYDNVPEFVFDNWVDAGSAGAYYNSSVKGVYG